MKKTILICLLTFVWLATAYSQREQFETLLDSAKSEFKKDFDQQDYEKAVEYLEKAVSIKPDHAEARYFLGYAYSRVNSKDGKSLINSSLPLINKSSEQFERVNALTPKYRGEMVLLDPYSKITSEWGSMAMSYWHNDQFDSAKWAFNEGKKRGGFGDYILSLNKEVLDACEKNAILITSGDNFTIPLWYLQIAENYRNDVSIINISLLNTTWYPAYLSDKNEVSFDLPDQALDSIAYCEWSDSTITIGDFSWTIKPSYHNQYLLRGDRLFLSLLRQNDLKRDLYFTIGFDETMRLSLKNYLSELIIVDKLTTSTVTELSHKDYERLLRNLLKLSKFINPNSTDELKLFDHFRYRLLGKVNYYLTNHEGKKAKKLMKLLDRFGNEKKFPYDNPAAKDYSNMLRERI